MKESDGSLCVFLGLHSTQLHKRDRLHEVQIFNLLILDLRGQISWGQILLHDTVLTCRAKRGLLGWDGFLIPLSDPLFCLFPRLNLRPCILVMDSLKLSYHQRIYTLLREWVIHRNAITTTGMDLCNCCYLYWCLTVFPLGLHDIGN